MREEVKRKILSYIVDFLEVPHEEFGGFPPCPFAKAERLKNKLFIDLYDPNERELTEVIKEMVASGYESGVFALFQDGNPVEIKEEETRSFQKFLNKTLKKANLAEYKCICINPKDQLEEMSDDKKKISADCQFCGKKFQFSLQEIHDYHES